jgi:hypothetical protein
MASPNGGPKKNDKDDLEREAVQTGSGLATAVREKVAQESAKNGIYKGAKYHHAKSSGVKNPPPTNGQKALDCSEAYKATSSRRISVSEGEIVVFDETLPGEFHGHVRTWEELESRGDDDSQAIMAFLRKVLWVSSKGKIIK